MPPPSPITDVISRKVKLRASPQRVWQALTNAQEFGSWFGVALESPFQVGKVSAGQITEPGFEFLRAELSVHRMTPDTSFGFRWHPAALDPTTDYTGEPMTIVEFLITPNPEGCVVTITESGFAALPAARAASALATNSAGWDIQAQRLSAHLAANP